MRTFAENVDGYEGCFVDSGARVPFGRLIQAQVSCQGHPCGVSCFRDKIGFRVHGSFEIPATSPFGVEYSSCSSPWCSWGNAPLPCNGSRA